jgi:ribosomal protein S18 acetylase RimI-like enzyme
MIEVRALQWADLPAAARLSAAAFHFDISRPEASQGWRSRLEHTLDSDPSGSFVAEREGETIGIAQAMLREGLWCLSLLTVDPGAQSRGVGRALLARTLRHGAGARAGLIVSSNDPRALRMYARAGFSLRPTLEAQGRLDRRALPPPDPEVHEGGSDDLQALESISREIRGAPHTRELDFALRQGAQLFMLSDRGFSVAMPGHTPWLLVARDETAAQALLNRALLATAALDEVSVPWLTAGQDWAVDMLVRAGLSLQAHGALCVRGEPGPLRPFVPSGPFA